MKHFVSLLVMFLVWGCSAQSPSKPGGLREMKASEIVRQLNAGKNIHIDSCLIWDDLNFTQLADRNTIAPAIGQVYVGQSVTFTNCVFVGKVSAFDAASSTGVMFARNLSFVRCDFRGEVDFTETIVEGNVFLTGSSFCKKANWQGAYFKHKKTYFNETKFEDEALFQNTVFAGDVSFMDAVFDSTATFQKAKVAGLMMFGNVKFNGYADFSYVKATESIFNYTVFKGRYDFDYSQGIEQSITN
jgi:uncharacterized protein YjbI with pentapeptide repeats